MYSFDTTIFVELERYYPKNDNEKMWNIILDRMETGEILVSAEVIEELNQYANGGEWIREDYPNCVVESDQITQTKVAELVNKYYSGNFASLQTDNKADPFVIALAINSNSSVVSLERINQTIVENPDQIYNPTFIPKIPNICQLEDILHFDLTTFIVDVGDF